MGSQSFGNHFKFILLSFVVIFVVLLACARSASPAVAPWNVSGNPTSVLVPTVAESTPNPFVQKSRAPGEPILSPTPDSPRTLPTMRVEPEQYIVKAGDTLGQISQRYSVGLESLVDENNLANPNLLDIGQVLTIPPPTPGPPGSGLKLIPDSELVYSPSNMDFDVAAFINSQAGYLSSYGEEVENDYLTGSQIIERIAYEYSVNPRILLAALEYQSGWVSRSSPDEGTLDYPMRVQEVFRKGLYRQLAWTANFLNRGFYLWRVNGVGAWITASGDMIPINPAINAGTAGVQHLFSLLYDRSGWEKAVSENGIFAIYDNFFGYPFDYAYEPLIPANLSQPAFQLPFESGKEWSYTGGPHGGWGSGSAWAAIDFAPPGQALGCVQSDEWIVAIADGLIVRAANGAVVQDLDGDGHEQTGWTILYMHIESRDRVQPGVHVKAGDRIGHPSCEGGVSTGTHVHLARRYNGEWISADQTLPFVLDGWVSRGLGSEYDGYLVREGHTVEALEGRYPANAIQR